MKKRIFIALILWLVMVAVGYAVDRKCGECGYEWWSESSSSCYRCRERAKDAKKKRDAAKAKAKDEKSERDKAKAKAKVKAQAETEAKAKAEAEKKIKAENKIDTNNKNQETALTEDELRAKIEAELREKIKAEMEAKEGNETDANSEDQETPQTKTMNKSAENSRTQNTANKTPAEKIAIAENLFRQATASEGGKRNKLYEEVSAICREVVDDEKATEREKQTAGGLRYSATKLITR